MRRSWARHAGALHRHLRAALGRPARAASPRASMPRPSATAQAWNDALAKQDAAQRDARRRATSRHSPPRQRRLRRPRRRAGAGGAAVARRAAGGAGSSAISERLAAWSRHARRHDHRAGHAVGARRANRRASRQQAICDTLEQTARRHHGQHRRPTPARPSPRSRAWSKPPPKRRGRRPKWSPSCARNCPTAWCATPPCWRSAAACWPRWRPCSTRSTTPPPNSARRSMRWSPPRPTCSTVSAPASPNRSKRETGKLGRVAAQVTGSAVEVASLGEAFGAGVASCSASPTTR